MVSIDKKLAGIIDHTLLKAEATKDQIIKLCEEAIEYGFKAVCVNPYYVPLAGEHLKGKDIGVCTVIGFPLGANYSGTKAYEAERAVEAGASELDMVLNIGALKSGDYSRVKDDIQAVVKAASGNLVKVILETGLLNQEEKLLAAKICFESGVDFLKTSTGFNSGASVEDVLLLKQAVPLKVKASGGIKTRAQAQELVKAGADRIGTSSGINLVIQQKS